MGRKLLISLLIFFSVILVFFAGLVFLNGTYQTQPCHGFGSILGLFLKVVQAQLWTSDLSVCADSVLITPTADPGVFNLSFDWSWNTFITPGIEVNTLDCPDNFEIQVDDNPDFSSPIIDDITSAVNPYTISSFSGTPETTYYWRISIYTNRQVTGGYYIWTDWVNGPEFKTFYVDLKANKSDGPLDLYVPNTNVVLDWNSSGINFCIASGDWSGNKPPVGSENLGKLARGTVTPGQGKTYRYVLTSSPYNLSDDVQITVWQYPICSFSANPTSIILPQTSTLSWSCSYADTCLIDQGVGSVSNISGLKEVRPSGTTTYALICNGIDGQDSWQATVNVGFTPKLREVAPW